jgi:SEC-C motif
LRIPPSTSIEINIIISDRFVPSSHMLIALGALARPLHPEHPTSCRSFSLACRDLNLRVAILAIFCTYPNLIGRIALIGGIIPLEFRYVFKIHHSLWSRRMKVGRNDPCPCGSGKKYKHCCVIAESMEANRPVNLIWRRLRELLDVYPSQMLRFIKETYGPLALHEAWAEFICDDEVEFDSDTPLMQLFMPWFFHRWSPDPSDTLIENESLHEVIPTAAYLSRKGRQLDPLLRKYLESLLTSPLTFFEVIECEPGARLTLRDVMTQEQHVVAEKGLSQGVQHGDLLFAQLASVGDLTMVEACNGFVIPPIEKASIIELRADIATAYPRITNQVVREWELELLDLFHEITDRLFNPPMPTLQNTDGEPLSLHKLVFDLNATPPATFDALKYLALDESKEDLLADAEHDAEGKLRRVRFSWKKRGNAKNPGWDNTVLGSIEIDGLRLTAEVNSEARAEIIRKTIEAALGKGVRYRASEIQSPERMLAELQASGGAPADATSRRGEELAAVPEVRAKISEMMAAHWEHWVDEPLPILRNRTPMEAVKNPDGREIVESLVIQGERSGRTPNMATDEQVFKRVRERLGLAAQKRNRR